MSGSPRDLPRSLSFSGQDGRGHFADDIPVFPGLLRWNLEDSPDRKLCVLPHSSQHASSDISLDLGREFWPSNKL